MDIINLQNLNLYYNYDSRFKTIAVCLYFYFPIEEKYIPETLMLSQMLQKTSKRFPTEESFAYHLKSIYDGAFNITSSRTGKMQSIRVSISFINPKYIIEDINILEKSIFFLFDTLLNPNFNEENLQLEKDILIQYHQNIYNNKTKYASRQFYNAMYDGEIESVDSAGTIESVKKVTLDSIKQAYEYLINAPCYLFVTGDTPKEPIVEELNKYDLSRFKSYKYDDRLEFIDSYNKIINEANEVVEEQDINQTILFMGYRSTIRRNTKYRYAYTFLSAMLGEYFHSTLFQVVREKYNLAYSIGTTTQMNKGAIHVFARISKDSIDIVKKLIIEEIEKYQDGIIDDKTFKLTKTSKINDVLKNGDSPFNPLFDLQEELMGFGKISDDIIIENINNLTKEDIKEVANMLVLDTIYILKGRA